MTDAQAHLRGSSCAMVTAVRRGEVRPSELVDAALARIAATDGRINAFTAVLAERARARAAELDVLPAPMPLRGVPFAVKDLFDIQGIATLAGSKIQASAPPATQDALLVQRLEAAGA